MYNGREPEFGSVLLEKLTASTRHDSDSATNTKAVPEKKNTKAVSINVRVAFVLLFIVAFVQGCARVCVRFF